MKNHVKKLAPISVYDMKGMENWLHEWSAEGYRIQKIGPYFVHFTYVGHADPSIRYRLMPAPRLFFRYTDPNIPASWIEIPCQSTGAKIYVAYDEKAEDLYIDDSAKTDILWKICRAFFHSATLLILFFVVMYLFLAYLGDASKQPIEALISADLIAYSCLLLPLFFLLIEQRNEKKIIMQQDVGWESAEIPYHPKLWGILRTLVLVFTLLLPLTNIIIDHPNNWAIARGELPPSVPAIELAEVEGSNEYLLKGYSDVFFIQNKFSPFAPVQYNIRQSVQIENNKNVKQEDIYEPSLKTEYYRLINPYLAEKLLEELIHDAPKTFLEYSDIFGDVEMTELTNTNFDKVVLFHTQNSQQLFALRGNEVISLWYTGNGNLALILDQLKEKMETAYKYKPKDVFKTL